MNEQDIAEQAYKNGYNDGHNAALDEFAAMAHEWIKDVSFRSNTAMVKVHEIIDRVQNRLKGHHIANRCVCCGVEVPEGRQVCPQCENREADVKC